MTCVKTLFTRGLQLSFSTLLPKSLLADASRKALLNFFQS